MSRHRSSRRAFVVGSAIGGGAVIGGEAALNLLLTTRVWAAASQGDLEVLNFALTLEYLEAEFYKQGNAAGILADTREKDLFALIEQDEQAHVQAISDTITKLGGTPVARPTIKYPNGTFANRATFVKTSKTFEEVGVGAYLGQAGNLVDKNVLVAAAAIFGVEARHAALVGKVAGLPPEGGIYMGPVETAMGKEEVLAAVRPFLS
jgi:rubrerythrin